MASNTSRKMIAALQVSLDGFTQGPDRGEADWVSWPPTARIVQDFADLRTLKGQEGTNIYVVGGATLVASLLSEDLIDELRLIVHPILLGGGKALFAGVDKRLSLDLVQAKSTESGRVVVAYRT